MDNGESCTSNLMPFIFFILAIVMVLFFTFQAPDASLKLSETVRIWLGDHGMDFDHNTFRTNAHLAEYFILGIALAVFTKSRGCKWWVAIVTGCGIGFLDEVVKIFLPGREFGTGDLIRDFIGVGIAVILVTLIIGLLKIDAK